MHTKTLVLALTLIALILLAAIWLGPQPLTGDERDDYAPVINLFATHLPAIPFNYSFAPPPFWFVIQGTICKIMGIDAMFARVTLR